jgi:hypothetical protein
MRKGAKFLVKLFCYKAQENQRFSKYSQSIYLDKILAP